MREKVSPFKAGVNACFGEVPRRGNPWDEDDYPTQRAEWFRGWDAMEKEILEAVDTVPMADVYAELGNPVG